MAKRCSKTQRGLTCVLRPANQSGDDDACPSGQALGASRCKMGVLDLFLGTGQAPSHMQERPKGMPVAQSRRMCNRRKCFMFRSVSCVACHSAMGLSLFKSATLRREK